MKHFTKIFICCLTVLFLQNQSFAEMVNGKWHNDLRTLFLHNQSIIYVINIRTFNAKDTNKNEIIDNDEESGNFINAIDRLDELQKMGINTLHVLPITSIGKLKSLGTAGSLYSISNFSQLNNQLKDATSTLSIEEQAKKFISECHKRNIRVIMDLPSCGSYDLFLEHPEYYIKDEQGQAVIPVDWTDVRVLDTGVDGKLNEDVYNLHKQFVDMALSIGADGIRADVATIRPYTFWENLIKYARSKNPEFMFLAEASDSWTTPPSKYAPFTTYDKLLKAGFDGYYGSFFNLKDWKNSTDLISTVQFNQKIYKSSNYTKTVIGSFTTHDETSPILINGSRMSKMIIWLNTTLPLNSYFVDGFATGDDYDYQWANKWTTQTFTDDNYYFNHKGKFDLFNFSRKPGGNDNSIYEEFVLANKFKEYYATELSEAKFKPLKTNMKNVFAYARPCGNFTLVVIGNLDYTNSTKTTIKIPGLKPNNKYINMRVHQNINPVVLKNRIETLVWAGDIQVLMFRNLKLK